MQPPCLAALPDEVVARIVDHAGDSPVALARLRQVNRRLAALAGADNLWRSYVPPHARYYGHGRLHQAFAVQLQLLNVLAAPTAPVSPGRPAASAVPLTVALPDKAVALRHLYRLATDQDPGLRRLQQQHQHPHLPSVLTPARFFCLLRDAGTLGAATPRPVADATYVRASWLAKFFCVPPQTVSYVPATAWRQSLLADYDLARALLLVLPGATNVLPVAHLRDPEFLQAALKHDGVAAARVAGPLPSAAYVWALTRHPHALASGTNDQRNDSQLVNAAAQGDVSALAHASPLLRACPNFMAQQIGRNAEAIRFAAAPLHDDLSLALLAVAGDGKALAYLSPAHRQRRDLVLSAVTQAGLALAYAAPALRDDDEIVAAAVRQNGMALAHASVRLRDAEAIVDLAVRGAGTAIAFASPRLATSPAMAQLAVAQSPEAFAALPAALRGHDSPVLDTYFLALQARGGAGALPAFCGPLLLRQQVAFYLCAPSSVGSVGEEAHDEDGFRTAFVGNMLRQNGLSLRFLTAAQATCRRYVALAVQQNGLALAFADASAKSDAELVARAVRQNGLALAYAAPQLQAHLHTVALAVGQNPMALAFAAPPLQVHPDFAAAAATWRRGRTLLHSELYARSITAMLADERALGGDVGDGGQAHKAGNTFRATRVWSAALQVTSNARTCHHAWSDLPDDEQFTPLRGRTTAEPPKFFAAENRWATLGSALPPPLFASVGAPPDLLPATDVPLQPRHLATLPFCGAMAIATCQLPRRPHQSRRAGAT